MKKFSEIEYVRPGYGSGEREDRSIYGGVEKRKVV